MTHDDGGPVFPVVRETGMSLHDLLMGILVATRWTIGNADKRADEVIANKRRREGENKEDARTASPHTFTHRGREGSDPTTRCTICGEPRDDDRHRAKEAK